jgi:hypothetical protein
MDKTGCQLPSFTKGVETARFELAKIAKINTPPAATYRFAESFPRFIFRWLSAGLTVHRQKAKSRYLKILQYPLDDTW